MQEGVDLHQKVLKPYNKLTVPVLSVGVVAFESLKTKEKSSWVIPKVVVVPCGISLFQAPRKSGPTAYLSLSRLHLCLRAWDRLLRERSITKAFYYKVKVTVQARFHKGDRN